MNDKIKASDHPEFSDEPIDVSAFEQQFNQKKKENENGVEMNRFIRDITEIIENMISDKRYDVRRERIYPYLLDDLENIPEEKFKDVPFIMIKGVPVNVLNMKKDLVKELDKAVKQINSNKKYEFDLKAEIERKVNDVFSTIKWEYSPEHQLQS